MHLTPDVQIGTPNMIDKNIMARVILYVSTKEGEDPLFEINNILVRRKDDELWIAMPSESFKVNTEQGEQTRWKNIVKIAPKEGKRGGDTPTPKQDRFHEIIMKQYYIALEKAKSAQTASAPTPATAPVDPGEPDF